MNCPRCDTRLETRTLKEYNHSVEVDQCPACRGIWFDEGELSRLEKVVEPTLFEMRHIPSEYDQLTALYCPSCSDSPLMKKAEHQRDHKVIMDYCPNCNGTWLDGGELKAIQQENWFNTLRNMFSWYVGR